MFRHWTRSIAAAVVAAFAVGSAAVAPPVGASPAQRAHFVIGFSGSRGVFLGERVSELRQHGYTGHKLTSGCTQFINASTGLVVLARPLSHRVVTVDPVGDPRYRTASGIEIGSTQHALLHVYRHHTIEKHLDGSFGQGASGVLVKGSSHRWLGFLIQDHKVAGIKLGRHLFASAMETSC